MKTQLLPDAGAIPLFDEEICRVVTNGAALDTRRADHHPSRVGICNEAGEVYRRVEAGSVDQLVYLLRNLAALGYRVVEPKKNSMFEWSYDAIVVK